MSAIGVIEVALLSNQLRHALCLKFVQRNASNLMGLNPNMAQHLVLSSETFRMGMGMASFEWLTAIAWAFGIGSIAIAFALGVCCGARCYRRRTGCSDDTMALDQDMQDGIDMNSLEDDVPEDVPKASLPRNDRVRRRAKADVFPRTYYCFPTKTILHKNKNCGGMLDPEEFVPCGACFQKT